MIKSNATSKYLLYAIGEITLVVIGILIALQINNWNESRKRTAQVNTYLGNLIDALNDDIKYLRYTEAGNQFRTNCIYYIFKLAGIKPRKNWNVLNYELGDELISSPSPNNTNYWWNTPIPTDYNREFAEECFHRSSYGNIVVINTSALEEFKNTGLFSFIKNEELKNNINHYYTRAAWSFSDWREANYRAEIDEWEDFLRDNHQINYLDISKVKDPIALIRDNKDIQLEMEELMEDASGRANQAGGIREVAEVLVKQIEMEIATD